MFKKLKNWYYKNGVITVFSKEELKVARELLKRYGVKERDKNDIIYKICYKFCVPKNIKYLEKETIVFKASSAEEAMKILEEYIKISGGFFTFNNGSFVFN